MKRKRNLQVYKKTKIKIVLSKFLKIGFLFFSSTVLVVGALFLYFIKDLPRPEKFTEGSIAQVSTIYDRTGQVLLYEIAGPEKRTIIPFKEIPQHLKDAVVVAEDNEFYKHKGIDIKSIIRAILYDLKVKKPVQGASTISQQLVRTYFLSQEKTLKRKTREILLTLELERRYSKNQILEWYLNLIPLGGNIYGVEQAARTFFHKSAKDLTLGESATIAALIKAPSLLSPYGKNKDKLLKRKDYILDKMVEKGYISKEQGLKGKKEKLVFYPPTTPIKAPHFVFYIKDKLEKKYGKEFLERAGLKIYTTLDFNLQQKAQEILKQGVDRAKAYNAHNAGLLAINPKTGEILAMVGSKNYFGEPEPKGCTPGKNCLFDPKVNTVLSLRQPGSAFKPFVYATAFKKGFSDQTIVIDEKTSFGVWGGKEYVPQNYDGRFRGPVTLREALAQSLNVPSVKVLLNLAGLKDSVEMAKKLGISTLTPPFGPSIVLGGWEVRLLEMVSAYGVFANHGIKAPLKGIIKIEDAKGNVLEENKKKPYRVLGSYVADLITDILSDNEARTPMFGRYSPLYIPEIKTSAKTGTTQDNRDAWVIGYTEDLVVGVWVGNNDNTPMTRRGIGVIAAGPIWNSFMKAALKRE